MPEKEKLKLAVYWAASCGGCDISTLEIAENLLKVVEIADIVFWPCVMDFKYDDVRAYNDKYIDVCFFNGAIRNSEAKEIAELLRKKSKVMVAYGSCSYMGGIPSLANLYDKKDIFERAYKETPSTNNPEGTYPVTRHKVKEGELELPEFYGSVYRLDEVIDVDYYVPGCPPTAKQTWACIEAIAAGKLPEKGSIIGAGTKAVCDECPFEKSATPRITRFKRHHLDIPDLTPKEELGGKPMCLLEQGFVCMGPATRSGCEAQCLQTNMPCRGCYGPAEGVYDQGGNLIGAMGSLVDSGGDEKKAQEIADTLVDPAGTFYRFGVSSSLLKRARSVQ